MSMGLRFLWCGVLSWTIICPSHTSGSRIVDFFVVIFGLIMITDPKENR